ncbi:MAG: DUF5916 domain-containing protein, partial [Acidobacteria bacterium]|nr:DUF5916 domain-containing protein [Acidobacteriota bacterium]
GIQGDGVLTEGGGDDISVDLLLESKGIIGENGYTVEVAIPFKSLRYEAGKGKLWGAHFFRRIQRFNREMDSWMPISRSISGNLNQAGHLTGLEGISAERTLELIPSLTLSQSGRFVRSFGVFPGTAAAATDPGRIVNDPITLDPGLTAKFTPSSALTLDLAINPDFAQVEADQLVVTTNQRFPIFFSEKRPFFLEGIDIFRTPISAVHTRSIVDPDVAVKLSGKKGRNTFGLMIASDNGPGNLSADDRGSLNICQDRRFLDPRVVCNNERFVDKNAYVGVLRLKRDIGKGENTIGILATTYNFIEKHNDLGAIDGRFRLDKQTTFSFQLLGTTSRNFFFDQEQARNVYRTGKGLGYMINYNKSGRNFGWELYGEGYTKDYRADVGFFGRTNTNFSSASVRYDTDPKPKAKIISRHFHNFSWIGYDFQGRIQNWESEFNLQWRGGGRKYPRVSPAALLLGQRAPLDPGAGHLFELRGGVTYQPTSALRTSLNLVKQTLKRRDTGLTAFDVNILTFRGTYQFTRATFARAIVDYNTLSSRMRAQLLAGWTPSPGTSFYVGYNDDLNYSESHPFTREIVPGFRRNSRTYFIKMSYLFRKSFGG